LVSGTRSRQVVWQVGQRVQVFALLPVAVRKGGVVARDALMVLLARLKRERVARAILGEQELGE